MLRREKKWYISAKATDNSTWGGSAPWKIMKQRMVAISPYLLQMGKLNEREASAEEARPWVDLVCGDIWYFYLRELLNKGITTQGS